MCHLFLFEAECSLFTVYCSLVQALQQLYFSSFLFTILAGSGQLSFQGWLGTSGKSLDSAGMLGESQGWQLCILWEVPKCIQVLAASLYPLWQVHQSSVYICRSSFWHHSVIPSARFVPGIPGDPLRESGEWIGHKNAFSLLFFKEPFTTDMKHPCILSKYIHLDKQDLPPVVQPGVLSAIVTPPSSKCCRNWVECPQSGNYLLIMRKQMCTLF